MSDNDQAVIEELTAKLKAAEAALLKCERLEVANRFAGAVIHEINNPLEALSNLVFLTKIQPDVPQEVVKLMETAEEQLRRLGDITRKTLGFFKDQTEARDFDLIDIAESALRLHDQRTGRQNVELRKRFKSPAVCKVFGGEILQIVSISFSMRSTLGPPKTQFSACASGLPAAMLS